LLSARATRGLEGALFLGLVSPLLLEWFQTTSASSRLSYALLVPGLALALAWRALRAPDPEDPEPPEPGVAPGLARSAPWAALAAAGLLGGTLAGVFTLSLLAVPLGATAFAVRHLPRSRLRRAAPALALLFLMVPPPMPLLDRVNPFLIRASGATAQALLTPFDAGVGWRDATLTFQGWTLIVAEACSGSGTFLMLGVLGAFLAALFRLRPLAALVLVLASLPLTLAVNGVRIASSALVIARFGASAGEGLAHELLGQVVVIAGAGLLALLVERASAGRTEVRA